MTEQMKPSGIDWIGDIPNEWGITKVRFVTKLRSEQSFYSSDDKYIEDDIKDVALPERTPEEEEESWNRLCERIKNEYGDDLISE